MTIEEIWEPVRADGQAKLNAAGFSDVILVIGYFRYGAGFRLEARLNGEPNRAAKARKLLPFSDNQN